MQTELPLGDMQQALGRRDFAAVRQAFAEWEPADVADCLEQLEPGQRAVALRVLAREQATKIFEYLEPDAQESVIRAMGDQQVAQILNDMAPDERTSLLEEMPAPVTQKILTLLSPEERKVASELLGYPDSSVGRLMTPDFIACRSDWTVKQTLKHIRRTAQNMETLNVLYVVDDHGRLVDDLRIRHLILAEPWMPIAELCDGVVVSLRASDDQEPAIQVFREYDRVALPVTDSNGVLLGIVTHDDVLDVAEEEATEDIQKIGGSEALEAPYLQIRFFEMARKRAVWLIALFFGQLLTLNALDVFYEQLSTMLVLVLFVPLIISSGGNSGSQAATLVIRAMALEEVRLNDWWRVLRRELGFGLVLGVIVASIGVARVLLGSMLGEEFAADGWLRIGLAVGLSLVCVVIWGVLVGSMLPFVLRRLGADPATSSTPFVTTVVDVTGLLLYLVIATAILV